MPPGLTHEQHLAQIQKQEALKARGTLAMGFDQDAVRHHFSLRVTGGEIEVDVRDQSDIASLNAIRAHLRTIARQFAAGNFEAPFATHGEMPPGVPVLRQRLSSIAYTYREIPLGARVEIRTQDPDALSALHEFLRYQIRGHRTGDPFTVS